MRWSAITEHDRPRQPRTLARYWEALAGGRAHCLLCPQDCHIPDGRLGLCRVRLNEGGSLYSLNYGRVSSLGLDPIEKKPLYRFHPGSYILSLGTLGCNLACGFCQNWQISQADAPTEPLSPEQAAELAVRPQHGMVSIGLAYTYSEPSVWAEYILDTAPLARAKGLKNVLVTNGYIREGPLKDLIPWVDAANVDLKSFRDEFYRRHCAGRLEPVLGTIARLHRAGVHVEVTTLLIPGENDGEAELRELVDWLAALDPDIPLHVSRYHPAHRFTIPPTPVATLRRACGLARRKLRYVYAGNVPDPDH
ncbi:MAG: AmmeMemoRadiSam system radical SAM enzyme [Bacillota bacterium]